MIVVDNAGGRWQDDRRCGDQRLTNPAGRMIFARLKEEPLGPEGVYYPLDSEF